MQTAAAIRRIASEDAGFTLVELLVSLVVGLVVAMASFALLEFTTKVVGRVTDQVAANQLGRQAIAYLENELGNACVMSGGVQSDGSTWGPIQYGLLKPGSTTTTLNSDANDLVFWSLSATGSSSSAGNTTNTTEALHWVQFTSNELLDTSWTLASGSTPSAPSWVSTTPTTTTLGKLNNLGIVSQVGATPMFQYYQYSSSNYTLNSTPTSPLTSTSAPNIAAVQINFQLKAASADSSTASSGQSAPYVVNDVVDLRETALQNSSSTNLPYPCQ
jgi:prepilin-type N-terminal cleavage/methylation domain-containing protein